VGWTPLREVHQGPCRRPLSLNPGSTCGQGSQTAFVLIYSNDSTSDITVLCICRCCLGVKVCLSLSVRFLPPSHILQTVSYCVRVELLSAVCLSGAETLWSDGQMRATCIYLFITLSRIRFLQLTTPVSGAAECTVKCGD